MWTPSGLCHTYSHINKTRSHIDDSVDNASVVDVRALEAVPSTAGGWLLGYNVGNSSTTNVAYLVFFNLVAASVVLGTTVPYHSVTLMPTDAKTVILPRPLHFPAGFSFSAVGNGQLGSGAVNAALTLCVIYE